MLRESWALITSVWDIVRRNEGRMANENLEARTRSAVTKIRAGVGLLAGGTLPMLLAQDTPLAVGAYIFGGMMATGGLGYLATGMHELYRNNKKR
jgi:uncharacterized membrane protein YebE (DUF533 family)